MDLSLTRVGLFNFLEKSKIEIYTQNKFDELRKNKILFFRDEFEKNESPSQFRKPGNTFANRCADLDRVWGAEYLRKKFKEDRAYEKYRVPRFVIILENHVRTLPVRISQAVGCDSLIIQDFDTTLGEVLVEEIQFSTYEGRNHEHRILEKLGYVDFSDRGNILKDKKGYFQVVDTEWKSFLGLLNVDNNPSNSFFLNYAKIRFKALHPWNNYFVNVRIK